MLKKREIFLGCFDNFDYDKIADFDDTDVERILSTEGMIRSPRKVQAVINNARCYQRVREEYGSFCDYIWGFSGGKTILYQGHDKGAIPVSNGLSDRISKDLKKRGFKEIPHKRAACLAVPFPPCTSCKFLDLPPASLRNLQARMTENSLASQPPLLCGISLSTWDL